MPHIPPTNPNVREYSRVQSNSATPSTRQLPEEDANEFRVGFDHAITSLKDNAASVSAFPQNPASTFVSTTDRALNQTGSSLEQLKALSIRAASENTTDATRKTLDSEAKKLVSLIDRIANTTSLDGQNLLDGSIESISFQISLIPSTQKSIESFDARAQSLGSQPGSKQSTGERIQLQDNVSGNQGVQEGSARTNIISDFSLLVEGQNINESINIADQRFGGVLSNIANTSSLTDITHEDFGAGTAKEIAGRINLLRESGQPTLKNVFATASTTFKSNDIDSQDFSGTVNSNTVKSVGLGSIGRGDFSINGVDIDQVAFLGNDAAGTLVHAINAISVMTGVKAEVDAITGELSLEADDGRDIVLNTSSTEVSNLIFGGGQSRFSENFTDLRVSGRVTISADNNLDFFGSSKSLTGFDDFSLDSTEDNQFTTNTLADADLSTQSAAEKTEININQAISQVDNFSKKLAALRTEFESSVQAFGSIYQQPRETKAEAINSTRATNLAALSRNLMQQRIDTAIQAQANGSSQQVLFFLR